MPLRRPPNDPSPRLRALLEAARRPIGPVGEPGPHDTGPHDTESRDTETHAPAWSAPEGHPALTAPVVEPWLPDDTWVPPSAMLEPSDERQGRATGRHRRGSGDPPRVVALPSALRGARVSAPRLATVGLVLVAVLAAGVFATRVVWARVASAPQPVNAASSGSGAAPGSAVTAGSGRTAFGAGGAADAAASSTARSPSKVGDAGATAAASSVTVHVVGRVARPGVVVLPSGSRVTDAVARAGGALRDADLSAINLARLVVDGEQLRVPRPGEQVAPAPGAGGSAADSGGSGSRGAGGAASASVVNLNTGSAAELDALPGVGPVLARRIVDWRTAHGRFVSVDQLGEVSGIGEKLLGQLRARVAV